MAYTGKKLSEMKGTELAARLRKLAANPKTRHLVPTGKLPAVQQRQRGLNAYLDSPVASGSDLTNRGLAREREQATALQFGEQESAIGQAVRQSQGTQKAIDDWYGQYQSQLRSIQEQDRARQDQVAGQLKAFGEGSAALSAADNSRVHQEQVNDAALRGATASDRVAAQGLQAARSRDSLNAAYGSLNSLQGLAHDRFGSARIGNAGLSRIEAQRGELANRAGIDEKKRLLAAQKGAYRADYMSKGRQRERAYGLDVAHSKAEAAIAGMKAEQWSAEQRFDLIKSGINPDTMKFDPSLKPPQTASPSERKTQLEIDYFQKHGYWPRTGPPPKGKDKKGEKPRSGPGSLTPATEQKTISSVLQVAQVLSNGTYSYKTTDKYGQTVRKTVRGPQAIVRQLKAENVDPRVIRAAYSYFKNKGKLGPDGVKQAHALGIHVNGNFETI